MENNQLKDYVESKLDELWKNVRSFRQSDNFKAIMQACVRFRHLAPFNSMLVEIQRPGALYVLTEEEWRKKYDRGIKPNSRPVIILLPFGPVDYLFDISDTYPLKTKANWMSSESILQALEDPYKTKGEISDIQISQLMKKLCFHGVCVNNNMIAGSMYAARIQLIQSHFTSLSIPYDKLVISWPPAFLLSVNRNVSKGEWFASVCHELGHLFCFHLTAPNTWKDWPLRQISIDAVEFEAESVAWLVCEIMGIENPSEMYLSNYLNDNDEIPYDVSVDRILSATKEILNLCSSNYLGCKNGLLYKHDTQFIKYIDSFPKTKRKAKEMNTPSPNIIDEDLPF